jgi:hypothetical protein
MGTVFSIEATNLPQQALLSDADLMKIVIRMEGEVFESLTHVCSYTDCVDGKVYFDLDKVKVFFCYARARFCVTREWTVENPFAIDEIIKSCRFMRKVNMVPSAIVKNNRGGYYVVL